MLTRIAILGMCLLAVGACGKGPVKLGKDKIAFDGQNFRSKSVSDRSDRTQFSVTVHPVSASFEGAREAAAYEGTRHCLKYFGTSDILWSVGPETEAESLPVSDDTLTYQGTCQD